MSKMPAKKKSCFQITSVTQAQVAASNAADDTESLDDPDESRTEDLSSEIFDVSRADYEPEVCDRSSSEETLSNVVDSEASHAQSGQQPAVPAASNGSFTFRNVGAAGGSGQSSTGQAAVTQQSAPAASGGAGNAGVPASTSQSSGASSTTATTTSCSSRFRVIKLDHGTGEPFRRGRWTCTEFYEKESEGSVISRTVDSIKHPSPSESGADRDSGLGATGGSTVVQSGLSGQGPDSTVDAVLHSTPLYPMESQQQQVIQGSVTRESFSNKSGAVPAPYQQSSSHVAAAAAPQNLLPAGQNGLHQGIHVQKSPSVAPASQTHPIVYQTQQQSVGHHLQSQSGLVSVSQPEYGQQHLPVTITQTLPVANLSVGQAVDQGPSPVSAMGLGGAQVLGAPGDMRTPSGGVHVAGGQPASSSAPSLGQPQQQQTGGGMVSSVATGHPGASVQQQKPVGQYNSSAVVHGTSIAQQGTQNMAMPSMGIGNTPATNVSTTAPGQQTQATRNGMTGGMSAPGAATGGLGQMEDSRRKSDALSQVPVVSGKDVVRTLIPDSLQLPGPAVNSFFGISIAVDGDDDSASGASIVAIDNKIEQAMDLVKSHLMYAVREEVEVLKEQIKELYERNSVLERENAVLKSLANNEQLSQLSTQSTSNCSSGPKLLPQPGFTQTQPPQQQPPPKLDVTQTMNHPPPQQQPNVTSA
ncbi:TSC22 domain family protein 2-like [Chanos chanos]|uniref:TSC22 domain family protein 2-like n=1 Tax=Chanos chanos TaxID=29144 RepID=A0A6J2VGW1_CHACN|nr:TSC22 domain family protein 2-like [Chanos chanos]